MLLGCEQTFSARQPVELVPQRRLPCSAPGMSRQQHSADSERESSHQDQSVRSPCAPEPDNSTAAREKNALSGVHGNVGKQETDRYSNQQTDGGDSRRNTHGCHSANSGSLFALNMTKMYIRLSLRVVL